MAQYATLFASQLDDFFALVFLSPEALKSVGLQNEAHQIVIMSGVNVLRSCSPVQFVGKWLGFLGCNQAVVDSFAARKVFLFCVLLF
jgi:hypothetical protein